MDQGFARSQHLTSNNSLQNNNIMIFYDLRQNKNKDSKAFNKWFAYPVIKETVDLDDLASHMSNHNTVFSKGVILGMLTDMVGCIKELLLEGKNVKIADLAIFSLGIKNNGGADKAEDFNVVKHLKGVKLRARATGELVAKNLNASLKKAGAATSPQTTSPQTTSPQPSPSGEGAGQTGNENGNQGGTTGGNQGGSENQNQGGTTNPPSGGGNEND